MLRGNEHDVVSRALYRQSGDVQRLCVDETVNCAPEELAEAALIDVGSIEDGLVEVLPSARVVVVLS